MHAQEQPRLLGQGPGVIGEPRAVGRPHLDQLRAAARHDVGNAKAFADFDQLAARDDDLAAGGARQRVQRQQHRGGVVVDHQTRLGAEQPVEELGGVRVAPPAGAAPEVELQVRVLRGQLEDPPRGFAAERRPAEIRVQDDAGGVDDRAQRVAQQLAHFGGDFVGQMSQVRLQLGAGQPAADLVAQPGEHLAGGDDDQRPADFVGELAQTLPREDLIHRRQPPQALGERRGGFPGGARLHGRRRIASQALAGVNQAPAGRRQG